MLIQSKLFVILLVYSTSQEAQTAVITFSPVVEYMPCLLLSSLAKPKSVIRTCSGLWTRNTPPASSSPLLSASSSPSSPVRYDTTLCSLVYYMEWRKNIKQKKTKNKLMSTISPVQYHDHEGSPMGKEVKLRWEEFVEKVVFEPGVKKWRIDGWWQWRWWQRWVDEWTR